MALRSMIAAAIAVGVPGSELELTQMPTLMWSGGTMAFSRAIKTDQIGAVYRAGTFVGENDLDPTEGVDLWSTPCICRWFFVTKLHSDGSYAWSRVLPTDASAGKPAIVVKASGEVLVVGNFTGSADFDPSDGVDVRMAQGRWNSFIWRFDAEGGYLGTTVFGATLPVSRFGTMVYAAHLDAEGSLVIAGNYDGNTDFDPGPSLDWRSSTSTPDVFVSKYAADGSYLWTQTFGYIGFDSAFRVEVDSANDIVLAGSFRNTVDFDPGDGVDLHTATIPGATFVSKYHSDGTYAWTRTYQMDVVGVHTPLAVDGERNIWLAGGYVIAYSDWIDFDPTEGTDIHASKPETFVTKLEADGSYGGTFFLSSTDRCTAHSIVADDLGGLLLGGLFSGTVDFDAGPGIASHSAPQAAFLIRYLTDGTFNWARTWPVPIPGDVGPIGVLATGPGSELALELSIVRLLDADPGCATIVRDGQQGLTGNWIAKLDSVQWAPDSDADGTVALRDFAWFGTCFSATGTAEEPAACPSGCYHFDSDADDDVDAADFAAFSSALTGP